MQDTKEPKRCHISASLLNFIAFLILCMPILIALSVSINIYLYSQIEETKIAQLELKNELNRTAQITVRLASLEQFLQEYSPITLESLLPETNAIYPIFSEGVASIQARELSEQAQMRHRTADPIIADPWAVHLETASPADHQTSNGEVKDKTLAEQRFVDDGIVSLDTFTLEANSRTMRFTFNLYNAGILPQVAGSNIYTLILATGEEISLNDATNTRFRINRYKKVVSETPTPVPFDELENAQIQIDIVVEEKPIYTIVLPLELKK